MKILTRSALAASAALAFASTSAQAATTVLTFDNNNCGISSCGNGSTFLQSYGDQPGLDISYQSLNGPGNNTVTYTGLRYWAGNYGSLQNVIWGGNSDSFGVPEITFLLTAPGSITLNSLDFAGWPNTNRNTDFRVYDLAYNLLFASGPLVAPGQGFATQNFNISSNSGLRLQWGPSGYNAGVDNLSFTLNSPAVPEPATWMMMLVGFGLIGWSMRRSKKKLKPRFA
jgi:PEP-CTERM motif